LAAVQYVWAIWQKPSQSLKQSFPNWNDGTKCRTSEMRGAARRVSRNLPHARTRHLVRRLLNFSSWMEVTDG
jgi:hypothetical protein